MLTTRAIQATVVATFDEVLTGVVRIVGVSDEYPKVAACEAELQKTFGTQVSAARSQPYYLDVTQPTANKGAVIERLARFLKIPTQAVATIGDQPTDVLMFERSGLSIAVGNASEEVRRQAMHVTTSNADEGFANAVEQFILPRAMPAGTDTLKATGQLNRLGQSLWLDNITRDLLTSCLPMTSTEVVVRLRRPPTAFLFPNAAPLSNYFRFRIIPGRRRRSASRRWMRPTR